MPTRALTSASMARTARSINDYDDLTDPIRTNREAANGNQLGDPATAAQAVLDILDSGIPVEWRRNAPQR